MTVPHPFTAPRQGILPGFGDPGNRAEPMVRDESEILHAALVVVMHGRPGTGIGSLLLRVFPGLAKRRAAAEAERCADAVMMATMSATDE